MKKRIILFVFLVSIFTIFGVIWFFFQKKIDHQFRVTFFDVGQGDSALIHFRNNETMLIDCGPDKSILYKLGKSLGFKRVITHLVITHFDADHYAGCVDVLRRYRVEHVYVNGQSKQDAVWDAWMSELSKENSEIFEVRGEHALFVASTTIQFLFPLSEEDMLPLHFKSNNFSIVTRLSDVSSGESILFMGDLEGPGEDVLIKKYCTPKEKLEKVSCTNLRSRILKIGHHGSDTSSGEDFIRAVSPAAGIISVGKKNHFGHPSLRILKRLQRSDVRILRTDKSGDIIYAY